MTRQAGLKKGRRIGPSSLHRLVFRVTLRHIKPPIWREIDVPDTYSLLQLHRCIQLVFGWLDYHLFEFQIGDRRFEAADPEAEGEDAARVKLLELKLTPRSSFLYIYDMGDSWEHDITVQAVAVARPGEELDRLAYLTDGARAAPPEDVGGPHGYERAIEVLATQRVVDDDELLSWLGADFAPELFDLRAGNHALMLATAWGVI